jgi:hypothetical protein
MSFSKLAQYGYAQLYQLDPALHGGVDSIIARSGMDIDADGAWGPPGTYAPPNSGLHPLDILADGGYPHSWYGGPTDGKGNWIVQGHGDPAPGYIVSGTAWKNPDDNIPDSSQRKYVDSLTVPYWVRPRTQNWIQHGQLGIAFIGRSSSEFVVADTGPSTHYGEGSVNLAEIMGINPSATKGGVASGVFTLIFTGTRIRWGDWDSIAPLSNEAFEKWGGVPKFQEVVQTIWGQ